MNESIKISVIIPIYNVEKYLKRCLNSVVNQSYKNIEIILVDDGSPDKSGEICDEYAKKDSRIRVIHQQNAGLPEARNSGLKIATGDYIGFVDSDDYISIDMYECLASQVKRLNADIACCGIYRVFDEGRRIEKTSRHKNEAVFSREEAFIEFQLYDSIGPAAWNKIFRRNLFGDIRFRPYKRLEDFWYVGKCISRADRISYSPVYGYNYMIRKNSITHSKFREKDYDIVNVADEVYTLFNKQFPKNTTSEITKILWYIVCINEMILSGVYDKKMIKKCKKIIIKNMYNILRSKYLKNTRKSQLLLFSLNYKLYEACYKKYMRMTIKG